jgi:hypothetical protein
MRLPPRRLLNVVFFWALNRVKPENREEWIRVLNEPLVQPGLPSGRREPTQAELEADSAAFMAAMAGKGKM